MFVTIQADHLATQTEVQDLQVIFKDTLTESICVTESIRLLNNLDNTTEYGCSGIKIASEYQSAVSGNTATKEGNVYLRAAAVKKFPSCSIRRMPCCGSQ